MKIFSKIDDFKSYKKNLKGSIGFIPTMGALHKGHLSLIKRSVKENDFTFVSIFVNPAQFLKGEDLDKYPRKIEADIKICELAGVDALLLPEEQEIYSKTEPNLTAPSQKSYILEGYERPSHFDGVLRVVLKLLNITEPDNAYFGKKDAQQLYLIQNMVKTLFLDINIVPCEIVREEDGLALSSRNVYLNEKERKEALKLSKSLKIASEEIIKGERNSKKIKEKMFKVLEGLDTDYIEIVDREFNPLKEVVLHESIILVAAKVGTTRLIDNIWI